MRSDRSVPHSATCSNSVRQLATTRFGTASRVLRVVSSYNCDTLLWMERAISIRLDDDAQHALRVLTKSGRSQSEAVREALIALARSRRRADLASEAERLNADRADRAEKKRIAKMMESLRAAG